jgi:hypothetical protein
MQPDRPRRTIGIADQRRRCAVTFITQADQEYFERRARIEQQMAERAMDPTARRTHSELAERYRDKVLIASAARHDYR